MKNLKQMKNVRVVLILLALVMLISSISYASSNNNQGITNKTEKEKTEVKLKTVKVDNSINEDLKLNIEQLRKKYSIKWFEDRYGKAEWIDNTDCCNSDHLNDITGIVKLPDGNKVQCYPDRDLNKFTDNQIKSIFVNFDNLSYNTTKLLETVYQDLYEKKEDSKWYHLKDFLYSKQVLFNLSKKKPKGVFLIFKYVPQNLEYYKEFLLNAEPSPHLEYVPTKFQDDSEIVYKAAKHENDEIQYASPRLQKIYKEQGLEGLKKEAEKTRNNYNIVNKKGN